MSAVAATAAAAPHVALAFGRGSTAEYAALLRHALPDTMVHEWPDVPVDVDYAVVWRPPPEFFARIRVAKAVFNVGAGVDGLVERADMPALPVYRLEDAGMASQMAQYILAAVLTAHRRIDVYRQQQHAASWTRADVTPAAQFGVGILGLGMLGSAVARSLLPLGFPVAGWSRTAKAVAGVQGFVGAGELPAFLARSQVVACLLPLTPATRDLIDAKALAAMPRGAHLINVARGEIVVDADLLVALDDGQLASATLDVFRHEPLPADHPFWHHPRVTVTPHVSAVTQVEPAVQQIAARIVALERGEIPDGAVDRARGY